MSKKNKMIPFFKYAGCGNDFIIFDERQSPNLQLPAEQIQKLCHRQLGIGADGLIFLREKENGAIGMDYFNCDGSYGAMCGNGLRCTVHAARKVGLIDSQCTVHVADRRLKAEIEGDMVLAQLGHVHFHGAQTLLIDETLLLVYSLTVGVPHAVIVVDDCAQVEVAKIGALCRHHPHFAPHGANVNFLSLSSLKIRTFERGVEQETLACGSGAVASAYVYQELTKNKGPHTLTVKSGDQLTVFFEPPSLEAGLIVDGETPAALAWLKGPATFIFEGKIAS